MEEKGRSPEIRFLCRDHKIIVLPHSFPMLRLTYFPVPGRAFVARACFNYAGIPFEDERINKEQFIALRTATGHSPACPMGSLPVLTLPSGTVVCESLAIARYAAKRGGLYPDDPEQALLVDEILHLIDSVNGKVPHDADLIAKKVNREAFAHGYLKRAFAYMASKLARGPYVLGEQVSAGDFAIYGIVKTIRAGFLDYVPTDSDAEFPEIQRLVDSLEGLEKFQSSKL